MLLRKVNKKNPNFYHGSVYVLWKDIYANSERVNLHFLEFSKKFFLEEKLTHETHEK